MAESDKQTLTELFAFHFALMPMGKALKAIHAERTKHFFIMASNEFQLVHNTTLLTHTSTINWFHVNSDFVGSQKISHF